MRERILRELRQAQENIMHIGNDVTETVLWRLLLAWRAQEIIERAEAAMHKGGDATTPAPLSDWGCALVDPLPPPGPPRKVDV